MLNDLSGEYLKPDIQIENAREAKVQLNGTVRWMQKARVYRKLLGDLSDRGILHPWQEQRLHQIDTEINATFGDRAVEVLSQFNRATYPQSIESQSRALIFASPSALDIR